MNVPIVNYKLEYEEDAVTVRQRARQIAELLGFDTREQTAIATSVSEIVRNTIYYAKEGVIEFSVEINIAPQLLKIIIKDNGPGINDITSILEGRYKSKTGLGIGITGTRKLMDIFQIVSEPGKGTSVTLGKKIPESSKKLTNQLIEEISRELKSRKTKSPIEEIKQQNQELLATIDEVRKKQEELIRVNKELEDTNRGVVALYAELDERAEHLKSINELKAQFMSNISHEFKTPLNSIIALTRLLLNKSDGEINDEQVKQVAFIQKSTQDLSEMVNDLLDIAKVESGKITIKPEHFQIANLFATLRGMMRPLITNNEVNLVFENPEGLPLMYNDDGKIAQILRNFISNALKFTEKGEVVVRAATDEKQESIIFSVKDSGIGIANENHEIIFEEFSQIDNQIQKSVKGTGLGLPLSKKLVELIGGSVKLESSLGQGSTFYAIVPINYKEPVKLDSSQNAEDIQPIESKTETSSHSKMLIIDDEEVSRYILKEMLTNESFDIIEAENGKIGLEKAIKFKPDLIFLDIIMPEYNGFEVIEKLKEASLEDIPVIVLTSKELNLKEVNFLSNSVSAVISKENITQEEIISKIKIALTNRETGSEYTNGK